MNNVRICIVYDNQLHDKNLRSGWGFSCLVERSGKKILFDTGDNPEKLSFNFNKLQINPQDFAAVALSHNHWDHTGGLSSVLGKSKRCTLYFGQSYPASFQEEMRAQGTNIALVKDMRTVANGIFVGPQMGGFGIQEIPLTVQTNKGLVIIAGCAHPGIVKMIERIREELNKDIYLVLGGFHLGMSLKAAAIVEGFKRMGIKRVGACHCTGGRAISLFKQRFKEGFIDIGAGLIIEI